MSQLLDLVGHDAASSWRHELRDEHMKEQLGEQEAENHRKRAEWEIAKNVARAIVVGSGVDWTGDERLEAIVLDDDG